ncbi:TetR/AcrR family transcriptional regulator [Krasilnikoviella flava]|uniref:Transcriptional regulator, TetR family n=1 Tax=Krasilnikoviella flava TaxID=526729 RepID=A0A1T5M1K4_9MICO|nr:TetR/AcrR family transcriptional regulator C-terminal domain-containing protein [Krasilnikoviella flava]SKC81678.1 transcriptional regulator, TetR family [Krasilnikoviella flava]
MGAERRDTGAKGGDDVVALLWRGATPVRRGPRPRFSIDGIVTAATTIADARGLDAVTMQSVAESLGTTKMALYRYVPGRVELDALMLDTALGTPPPAAAGSPWHVALTDWARSVHARALARPWSVELAQRPHVPGPVELAWFESGLAALAGLPLTGAEKLDTLALLVGHVMSLVRQQPAGASPEADLAARLAPVLAERAGEYPHSLAAFTGASSGARDDALRFGVARVVAGVAALADERG